jgi:4-diphosphocytidyl-2-C-methyl-D-erythritol kinase
VPAARVERAPAKINLTLRIVGRRADGYHDLESLVVFAGIGDALAFAPARSLALTLRGATAAMAGATQDNLVIKAARALAERVEGIKLGRFELTKRLPVAAGLGGGSADAAAALRHLARANRIALNDPRVLDTARATGADVPVCLDPRPRVMQGIGDVLSAPLSLPKLAAVLVNPGVAVPTKDVFAALHRHPAMPAKKIFDTRSAGPRLSKSKLIEGIAGDRNDLEAPAIAIAPIIGEVLTALRSMKGCRLARMSGSGATCFGLFDSTDAASAAARALRKKHDGWWVRATRLG